jgi:hypothetical protein
MSKEPCSTSAPAKSGWVIDPTKVAPLALQKGVGGIADAHHRGDGGHGRTHRRSEDVMMDPYMSKTETLLREARALLDRRSLVLRALTPAFSVLARRRKLMHLEARYADLSRRFEMLRGSGVAGIADAKVGLEKSWDAFRTEIGWKS